MFKINKTTKYIVLALSLALVFFVGSMNTASAGSSNDYYMGFGLDNSSLYYGNDYSYPSYDYNNYSYSGYDSYDYSYPSYSYDYSYDYSYPSYYYDSYDYGCTSCGYSYYQPLPELVYVPNTNYNCTNCHTPPPTPPTPPTPTLDASCSVNPNNVNVNDTVTFAATASGGTGTYQYYWSGSDGLNGSTQVVTGRFTTPGSKTISLTVTSGAQTVTRTCSAYVNQPHIYNPPYYPPVYNNLTATCSASPSNVNVGDNVIWTVYPNGGIGGYSYSWTGTDGLSYGNAYQIQQRYSTPGTKTATVTVTSSNGQSITVSCNANVAGTINSGTPISGIYLNEIPATGISFNLKVALYTLGLLAWSAFVGFMLVSRRKNRLALANRARIEDFKLENMKRKNLI